MTPKVQVGNQNALNIENNNKRKLNLNSRYGKTTPKNLASSLENPLSMSKTRTTSLL
jgi:hypothetical protein